MEPQYKIETCKSQASSITKDEALAEINKINNGKAVVWYYDEIVFYNIKDNNWSTPIKGLNDVVRLRIFDKDKELHIWRSNGVIKGRLRNDKEGEVSEYVETKQILNGTTFIENGIGIKATEDKGICYFLPFSELNKLIGTKNRITLVARNYIDYSDIGQASYVDCRFVDFDIYNITKS